MARQVSVSKFQQMMDGSDIQIDLGGHRMTWRAVSERGRQWAAQHPDLTALAPEGLECLARFGEDLVDAAIEDGLSVMSGHIRLVHAC